MNSAIVDSLLIKLNATDLQQKNNPLYQFLKDLSTAAQGINNTVTNIVPGGGGGGFGNVTTMIGGTASTIAMFTASNNIENVTVAGISAALDLL